MDRDVEALVDRLRSIGRTVEALTRVAQDLHVLAYDRPASDEVAVAGGNMYPDPLTGDGEARRVFARLAARAKEADDALLGFKATVLNMLNVGVIDDGLWGSPLSPGELARAIQAQGRRGERGEYVPAKNMPQPRYPKKGDKR